MRSDPRITRFWLPLAGAIAFVLPLVFVGGRKVEAVSPLAPEAAPPSAELSCGAFVDSFSAMQAEAERISSLAASAAVPLEENVAVPAADVEMWREIAQAARALDSWMWEAHAEPGPLTLAETAIVSSAAPLTTEIRVETATLAGDMIDPPSEWDAASISRRMIYIARTSASVAKALEPLAICRSAAVEVSVVPPAPACETLDPEYQAAMSGPCL